MAKVDDHDLFEILWRNGVKVQRMAKIFDCCGATIVRHADANGLGSRHYPNLQSVPVEREDEGGQMVLPFSFSYDQLRRNADCVS